MLVNLMVYSLTCLALAGAVDGPSPINVAETFQFRLVNSSGYPVPFRVAEFRPECCGETPDRSSQFRDGEIRDLEMGGYRYRLVPEGNYKPKEGRVDVEVRNAIWTVEAEVDRARDRHDMSAIAVRGVLLNFKNKADSPTWVRMVNPYSGEAVRDAVVDSAGRFELGQRSGLGGFSPGNYVLNVFQGHRILAAQPVEVGRSFHEEEEIRVLLPAEPDALAGEPFTAKWLAPLLAGLIFATLAAASVVLGRKASGPVFLLVSGLTVFVVSLGYALVWRGELATTLGFDGAWFAMATIVGLGVAIPACRLLRRH